MKELAKRTGVTFAVDEVERAAKPLSERRMHEALKEVLGGAIESCSDYHGMVALAPNYQSLLATVYTAFSQHRPLVLTPDAVWLTISQGVAHHMLVHGERLRSRFVSHEGRLRLSFETRTWVAGTPENPWQKAFAFWADKIRDHVGEAVHDALLCDFSTSGPVEQAASRVVMMDVFERYFHYDVKCICGIPTVTLEGAPADWERLAAKVEGLAPFEMEWWLEHLRPICGQFVRASRGDVDLEHWQAICKLREEYGGDIINGWVAKLFPYLREFDDGPCTRRNGIFEDGEGFRTSLAPPGMSRVPFTWTNANGGQRMMEAIGGLFGVAQDAETSALRPVVGWAIREVDKEDALVARLAREHRTFPAKRVAVNWEEDWREAIAASGRLPPDLMTFYYHTDGAELFAGTEAACRIRAASELERLDWGPVPDYLADNDHPGNGHIWYRLADLADGSMIAVNPSPWWHTQPEEFRSPREFAAYSHCQTETQGAPGKNPVVALSFTELLERLLASEGRPYWLAPEFPGYGDAEEFTRRE